jgi:hypothetical protein
MQRYLRRIYADPITGKSEWSLIPAPSGGIMGVYSTAAGKPIRSVPGSVDQKASMKAISYRDWRFIYEPAMPDARARVVK